MLSLDTRKQGSEPPKAQGAWLGRPTHSLLSPLPQCVWFSQLLLFITNLFRRQFRRSFCFISLLRTQTLTSKLFLHDICFIFSHSPLGQHQLECFPDFSFRYCMFQVTGNLFSVFRAGLIFVTLSWGQPRTAGPTEWK